MTGSIGRVDNAMNIDHEKKNTNEKKKEIEVDWSEVANAINTHF